MHYEVVADTSPLQYLHSLGLLSLLPQLYGHVLVPGAVVAELAFGRAAGFQVPDPTVLDWVTIAEPRALLAATKRLGPGEAAAIALAVERSAGLVLLDDRGATKAAKALGLRAAGVLGVLLTAKQQGHITEVRSHIITLRNARFRMSRDLEREVCQLAGEPAP